jgi:hypothetical protein
MFPLILAAAVSGASLFGPMEPLSLHDQTHNDLSGAGCKVISQGRTILVMDYNNAIVRLRANRQDHIGHVVEFISVDVMDNPVFFDMTKGTLFDDRKGNQIQIWQNPSHGRKTAGLSVHVRVSYLNGMYDLSGVLACSD